MPMAGNLLMLQLVHSYILPLTLASCSKCQATAGPAPELTYLHCTSIANLRQEGIVQGLNWCLVLLFFPAGHVGARHIGASMVLGTFLLGIFFARHIFC